MWPLKRCLLFQKRETDSFFFLFFPSPSFLVDLRLQGKDIFIFFVKFGKLSFKEELSSLLFSLENIICP